MSPRKISRRDLMIGAGSAMAASALPLQAIPSGGEAKVPTAEQAAHAQHANLGMHRADWMQNSRYSWGVMTHYLADGQARVHKLDMTVNKWNTLVDGFDVEGLAKQLEFVGAGHYQLSIGQNSGFYL